MPDGEKRAEEIFKDFKRHSVAEFFTKNRQMLGYSGKIKSLTTVVHEYVTNSLDACEEASILPEIYVKIKELGKNYYQVIEQDNGPGIPINHLGGVFAQMLAGTKFHRYVQARGQQGIGAAGCTMFSQITTGQPTKIITGTKKGVFRADLTIDVKTNEPKLKNQKQLDREFRGVHVEAIFKDVDYINSAQSPYEYIKRTALANPHTKIVYIGPDNQKIEFERSVQEVPKPPQEIKPHPKGLKVNDLLTFARNTKARTLAAFLMQDFSRISRKKTDEIQEISKIDMRKKPVKLSWAEAEAIVKSFDEIKFLAPPTDTLRPIGEKQITAALENILDPEFFTVVQRPPSLYRGGVPFIVETAIAYGGGAGRQVDQERKMEILRYANRAPLLFDTGGCVITQAVKRVDWKRYGLKDIENMPVTIFVNVVSVHIPYSSAGKQSISDEEEIDKEIRFALMECGRRLKVWISGKRRRYESAMKLKTLMRYVPEVAQALSSLTKRDKKDLEKKLAKIVEERFGTTEEEAEETEAPPEDVKELIKSGFKSEE